MQVGVVVLNYFNFKETINCVNSLLKQSDVELEIVVVDNGSTNNSYDILVEEFHKYTNVTVLNSNENLGYARGNNIGISYLRNKTLDWIFVANSDLFFQSTLSMKQLVSQYVKGVGVINPLIVNPDGTVDQRVSYKKKYIYFRMIKKFVEWFTGKKIGSSVEHVKQGIELTKTVVGVQENQYIITGSGFLLCKDFFEHYSGLYSETFLYYEEWATILLLHKANLKTKVAEIDPIIHKGGASTPQNVKNMTKERRKICMNSWKAIFKLMCMSQNKVEKYY